MVALLVLARSHPGNQIRLLSSRATKIQSCSIANLESCNLISLSSSILSSALPSAFLLLFHLLTSDPLFRPQPIRSALCLFPYVDIVLVCSGLLFFIRSYATVKMLMRAEQIRCRNECITFDGFLCVWESFGFSGVKKRRVVVLWGHSFLKCPEISSGNS